MVWLQRSIKVRSVGYGIASLNTGHYIFCHDMVLKKYASIMQFCQPFDMWSVSELTHKLHDSVISS